jgi:hypothetical protein
MANSNMCMFVTNEPTILLLEEAIFSLPEQEFFFSWNKISLFFHETIVFFFLKYSQNVSAVLIIIYIFGVSLIFFSVKEFEDIICFKN